MLDDYIKWRREIALDSYDFSQIFTILLHDKVFEIIGRDKSERPIIFGRGQHFLPAQMYQKPLKSKFPKEYFNSDLQEHKRRAIYTLELLGRMLLSELKASLLSILKVSQESGPIHGDP